jgi:hypothetical protein
VSGKTPLKARCSRSPALIALSSLRGKTNEYVSRTAEFSAILSNQPTAAEVEEMLRYLRS